MAPTGSFYARYSSGSYKLAPTGKDNSTKVPPSRNEDSKPEPKESMRTESPPPPKTEDKTIDFTKPILDHGHSSSYWPGESEDPHQNRDWDADSKYLYSDYFLAMEASSNDLKLVEKMENLTVLGQNGESSGTCTRRKSEGKKRIVPILSMPENDLFGYSAADSDSDDGKESGQFDQARKDDNRPIGIRRMHPPPDAVRVTPQERLFHVDHLRVIWGVELPNSDRPTAPGVWHPNDGLHGTMPSIIITHSKGEPWVPSHPRERPSHGAVLDIYRDDKRWTTYSDDALPLFVEKARQKYEYTGHYRVVIRPEETLSRLAMIAQIEPHVQEFFAWKVWGHRYFREDFFKAVRESIVDRELVLAHARDPRTTLKWTDLMSSVREQKVKDAFFKDQSDIPLGLRLRWVYLEFIEYDDRFPDAVALHLTKRSKSDAAESQYESAQASFTTMNQTPESNGDAAASHLTPDRSLTAGSWKKCSKGGHCNDDCPYCKDTSASDNAQPSASTWTWA